MAKLTKTQRNELERVHLALIRARAFLMLDRIAIARRGTQATTTLHYTRVDGACLYEINKDHGSELVFLYTAIRELEQFLQVQP